MEVDHFSEEWDDAPMPHSIFFTQLGHAIHGTEHVNHLGRRASHGCVRLAPEDAATLYALVEEAGMANTTVVVKGSADKPVSKRPPQRVVEKLPRRLVKIPRSWSSSRPRTDSSRNSDAETILSYGGRVSTERNQASLRRRRTDADESGRERISPVIWQEGRKP